jgi:hypothetical protein
VSPDGQPIPPQGAPDQLAEGRNSAGSAHSRLTIASAPVDLTVLVQRQPALLSAEALTER